MDARRLLIAAMAGLLLSGCAVLRGTAGPAPAALVDPPGPAQASRIDPVAIRPAQLEIAPLSSTPATGRPYLAEAEVEPVQGGGVASTPADSVPDRRRDRAANGAATAASPSDRREGGVRTFAWSPGRVFEIWTAPLRVTTLTLGPGETLVAKAAGDTVRWQIGEAASGEGAGRRVHVFLKPFERGLETNLVLTTNQRVYLIELRSGSAERFNAAVAWDTPAQDPAGGASVDLAPVRIPDPVVTPEGALDARYRLEPQGRRPGWAPTAVFNDGRRTFIAFPPEVQVDEAPALFAIASDGAAQLVNYRQSGDLLIVDRVLERAELRLGDRRPQVVRIRRLQGDRHDR